MSIGVTFKVRVARAMLSITRSAAGALLISLAAPVIFGGSSALADCQPPAASGGTVTCTVAGGTQTTTVGTFFNDAVTVNVQPGASISVGPDAIGIFLGNQNLVTNFGTISAGDSSGAGPFQSTAGIFFTGTDNVAVNNGAIIVGNGSGGARPDAFGIVATDSSRVINNGAITTGNFSTGIFGCCANILTNSSTGVIQTGDSSFGIFGTDTNTVKNAGQITVGNGVLNNYAYGILLGGKDNTVTNTGTIKVGTLAIGMGVDNSIFGGVGDVSGNKLTNAAGGTIQVGDGSIGLSYGTLFLTGTTPLSISLVNNGTISAGGVAGGFLPSIGIFAQGPAAISNTGTITVGDGTGPAARTYGVFAAEDGSTVLNTGAISAGTFGVGVRAGGDNSTINNSASITVGANGNGIYVVAPLLFGPAGAAGTTINNSGMIVAGANGNGVNFNDRGTLNNSGTIVVDSNGNGVNFSASGTLNNSGTIIAGAGGTGVHVDSGGGTVTATLNNTGMIRATGDGFGNGFSLFLCSCTVVTVNNFGTLDGKVQSEGKTTFNNRGLMTITDTNAVTPIAGAFQFSITDIAAAPGTSTTTFQQFDSGTLSLRVVPDPLGGPAPIDSLLGDTVTLAGTLRASIQPGLYANTTTTGIAVSLTGNGALNITTTFDRFVSSSPFFNVTPIYNTGTAADYQFLTLQLDRIGFGSTPGQTPNERAVGTALEGAYSTGLTGNAATFYGNLLAASSVGVLDQLSGEGTSATQNAAFGAGSQFNGAMQNQSLNGPTSGGVSVTVPATQYAGSRAPRGSEAFASLKPAPDATQTGRWRIWSAGFAASHSLQGEAAAGSSSQSIRNYGGALGFDHQLTPDLLVGFSAGGSESNFSVNNLGTGGRLTGGHLGLYALKTWGAYYAAAALSYSRFDNSTRRQIVGIGPGETASGRFGSDQISGRLELGWKRLTALGTFTPFVAIEPAALWQSGYTESSATAGGGNGVFGLTVASHTATSLPTFVGVQFDTRKTLANGAVFEPFARVSWVHEFEPNRQVTAGFVTVPSAIFTVNGARAASDAARIDTGAKLALREGQTMFANFTGEWSDRTQSYAGTAGFRVNW